MKQLYSDLPHLELFKSILLQFGHISYRCPLGQFANIVGQPVSDILPALKDESFIEHLTAIGILLWFEKDLVCIVDSPRMKFRAPCGPYVCRLCLIDCNGTELSDPDPKSKRGKVHPQCMPRYKRLLQSTQMIEEREHANRY